MRRFARDIVDARRNLLGLFMPAALGLILVMLAVPSIEVQRLLSPAMLVLVAVMVVDRRVPGRAQGEPTGRREVPGQHRKRLEARLLRRQPRLYVAPDAGAAAAGQPRRSRRLTAVRILVLGGIQSGKSRWAETAVTESIRPGQPVHYLATGAALDGDAAWSARSGRTGIVGQHIG